MGYVGFKDFNLENIQLAASFLSAENIHYTMVGTGALFMHGKLPRGYLPGDIDFLVDRIPVNVPAEMALPKEQASLEGSLCAMITDGCKVDYIGAHTVDKITGLTPRAEFLSTDCSLIEDVRVATIKNVLGLKKFANRPDDRRFIWNWRWEFPQEWIDLGLSQSFSEVKP